MRIFEKLKNPGISLAFISFILLNLACTFPDNILEPQSINNYRLDKLKLGNTTLEEFKKLCPDAVIDKVSSDIVVIKAMPVNKDLYNAIRVGFRNNKLDWIEFILRDKVEMSKFTYIYGNPKNINTAYSRKLDYYDYDFFNISTDKKHTHAKCINVFSIPQQAAEQIIVIEHIPGLKDLQRGFEWLNPGYSLEADFNAKYPSLSPDEKTKSDNVSTYIIEKELGKAGEYYKNITLVFNNGLLSWINVVPQSLTLSKALSLYGSGYKLEHFTPKYDCYDYSNFVLVVDKVNKTVVNIGIVQ